MSFHIGQILAYKLCPLQCFPLTLICFRNRRNLIPRSDVINGWPIMTSGSRDDFGQHLQDCCRKGHTNFGVATCFRSTMSGLWYVQGVSKNLILRFSVIKSEINMACQKCNHHCIPNRMAMRAMSHINICIESFSCSSTSKQVLDVGATPADHLGQSHGLQVVDCSVHHLAGHGTDFSDYGALQLFGCPWLVFIDPIFDIAPKEEVERTLVWRVRRPLLQADDPAREALLESEMRCSSGMRSGAILREPLLLEIGTDGLELLSGLQATARTDRSSQTDHSTCRMDSTERAVRGLPLSCFLWNSLPSQNPFTHLLMVACQARLAWRGVPGESSWGDVRVRPILHLRQLLRT